MCCNLESLLFLHQSQIPAQSVKSVDRIRQRALPPHLSKSKSKRYFTKYPTIKTNKVVSHCQRLRQIVLVSMLAPYLIGSVWDDAVRIIIHWCHRAPGNLGPKPFARDI